MKTIKSLLAITLVLGIITGCQKEEVNSFELESVEQIHQLKTGYQTEIMDQILVTIQKMIKDGEIDKGNGNALMAKINASIKSVGKGQLTAAKNQLNAFINQTNTFIRVGILPYGSGIILIDRANGVFTPSTFSCGDNFTDRRDGNSYGSVQIGIQCWMASNLAYLPVVSGSSDNSFTDPYYYVYNNESINVAVAMANENYPKYGVLYNWEAARISCPDGWRLPTDEEWIELETFLGDGVANDLKATSGWFSDQWTDGNGTNSSGFTALPGGILWDTYNYELQEAYFWTSSADIDNSMAAWCHYLYFNLTNDVSRMTMDRKNGLTVRCIKSSGNQSTIAAVTTSDISNITQNSAEGGGEVTGDGGASITERGVCWSTISNPSIQDSKTMDGEGTGFFTSDITGLDAGTTYYIRAYATNATGTAYGEEKRFTTEDSDGIGSFTDIRDGHQYGFVTYGDQTWMAENLAYLPSVSLSKNGSINQPYYYVYGYEGTSLSAAKLSPSYTKSGVLYNYAAAINACPPGWHLPNDTEWTELTNYLTNNGFGYGGSGGDIGKSMAATSGWNTSALVGAVGNDQSSNNNSGFQAVSGGYRNFTGGFLFLGQSGYMWSSSENGSTNAWYRLIYYDFEAVYRNTSNKKGGCSVRCIRD